MVSSTVYGKPYWVVVYRLGGWTAIIDVARQNADTIDPNFVVRFANSGLVRVDAVHAVEDEALKHVAILRQRVELGLDRQVATFNQLLQQVSNLLTEADGIARYMQMSYSVRPRDLPATEAMLAHVAMCERDWSKE